MPVWLGEQKSVEAVPAEKVVLTLPRGEQNKVTAFVKYDAPLKAPVAKGQKVGSITISAPERDDVTVDLIAAADIKKLGYFGRMKETVKYLLFKQIN